MKEIKVGKVIHYFSRIGVAAIELQEEIKQGTQYTLKDIQLISLRRFNPCRFPTRW